TFEPLLVRETDYEEYVTSGLSSATQQCTHWQCVDVYRCGRLGEKVTVYIYPITRYIDEDGAQVVLETSVEYMRMLDWLRHSTYFVEDPRMACLFVPSVDTLGVQDPLTPDVLANLAFWEDGSNHLVFNQLQTTPRTGRAMHVSAALSDRTFRPGFDIAMPMMPYLVGYRIRDKGDNLRFSRAWRLVIPRRAKFPEWAENVVLQLVRSSGRVTLLESCTEQLEKRCVYSSNLGFQKQQQRQNNMVEYPKALENADFCLIFSGVGVESALVFTEAVSAGCIPVLVHNEERMILPFPERIDWLEVTLHFNMKRKPDIITHLESFSAAEIRFRREKLVGIYDKYMSSPVTIISNVMDILNERIFAQRVAETYSLDRIPQVSPKRRGFSAVILTYNRPESLRKLVSLLQGVPSLVKIIVVWNNPDLDPPSPLSKSTKPVAIVRSRENKLTNRFYPYKEIETEAVLSLDDDILMLTPDELEFGFQVWCENSNKIVGFPSRLHVWDNQTKRWRYESEWLNDISMVLTGAAFYHVEYGRHFFKMPKYLRDYVDSKFNCEDILMNFLVANLTSGAPPVKVAPRKKFKPDTPPTAANSLSASLDHMQARSECINEFVKAFSGMPLSISQCRADPVLFKDNLPLRLKRFNQVGVL
ncbi:hypothetical protein BIW11_01534, partial [Tropilaelaps mercedesae]